MSEELDSKEEIQLLREQLSAIYAKYLEECKYTRALQSKVKGVEIEPPQCTEAAMHIILKAARDFSIHDISHGKMTELIRRIPGLEHITQSHTHKYIGLASNIQMFRRGNQ